VRGMDIYYHPDKYGLQEIGEINFSSGEYEFDILALWRNQDRTVVYAADSGCSCPAPFENLTLGDLKPIRSLDHFQEIARGMNTSGRDRSMQIVAMVEKLRDLGVPANG